MPAADDFPDYASPAQTAWEGTAARLHGAVRRTADHLLALPADRVTTADLTRLVEAAHGALDLARRAARLDEDDDDDASGFD